MRPRSLAPFVLLAVACTASPEPLASVALSLIAPRETFPYDEPHAEAKRALLARINQDRRAAGVPPVSYDLRAAKVGDDFCVDSATRRFVGHWDTQGRPPYLRWALQGGVDFHAQNFASTTRRGYGFDETMTRLLLEAHQRFMDETPPDDGHRRTVLDPAFTHVGIGCAIAEGEFRMTQEFSRKVAEWVRVPAEPVKAGSSAPVSVKLASGWQVGAVEICHEPPVRPLTPAQIARRDAYGYPPAVRSLRPRLGAGLVWADRKNGDFDVVSGRMELAVPLTSGPGSYYVLVYVAPSVQSGSFTPGVAARIEAR